MIETTITDSVKICTLLVLGLYEQASIINGDGNLEWTSASIIGDHYQYNFKQIDTGKLFGHSFWYTIAPGRGWRIK